MAQFMKRSMMDFAADGALSLLMASALTAILTLMFGGQHAAAQTLLDPTRPPNFSVQQGSVGESTADLVLQSILIAPGRKLAIIDGKTVALNGQLGDATLIRISETEVVLKRGKELQTLKLFPNLIKRSTTQKARTTTELTRPQRQ